MTIHERAAGKAPAKGNAAFTFRIDTILYKNSRTGFYIKLCLVLKQFRSRYMYTAMSEFRGLAAIFLK